MKKQARLWHDDIRQPPDPDSWIWARTNEQAILILTQYDVVEASLDHDLGLDERDPQAPGAILLAGDNIAGCGYDLVKWMCERNILPEKVTIHSWNSDGARRMERALLEAGCPNVIVRPYQLW